MDLRGLMCVCLLLCTITGCVCTRWGSSIVGGHDASEGKWPWMVYVQLYDKLYSCGGTIITDQWIMTAAHCWHFMPLKDPFVRVGVLKLDEAPVRKLRVERVVVHPDYTALDNGRFEQFSNDIALLRLQEPIRFSPTVKPVTLPTSGDADITPDTAECWATGWGRVAENKPLGKPRTLQEVQLPLLAMSVCSGLYVNMTSGHLCAGDLNGGKDACMGDSGGPLVCRTAGGAEKGFVQVGITSFGIGCAHVDRAGVYTRVSTYMQFINETIATG